MRGWAKCLCRTGGSPSEAYGDTKALLDDNRADYERCKEGDEGEDEDEDEDAPEDLGRLYCQYNGFRNGNQFFSGDRLAYAPDWQETRLGGYASGTCGYAAMEHDEQWARCCCRDTKFCCPQGEERSCLSRDDWEDEWEDEEDDEWDRHHDADEDAIFAMLHEVHVLVVVVIVLLALLIVVLLAIAGLKYKAQAAAGSAIAAMGVELSTAGPSAYSVV